jgi:chorismate lyase / 3-hydroxybenzoate synthase
MSRRTRLRKQRIIYDCRRMQRVSEHTSCGDLVTAAASVVVPLQARAPRWVEAALATGSAEMFTAVVSDAAAMSAETLRASVSAAYGGIGNALRTADKAAIRLWNYLPDPAQVMGPGLDRYMVFNAGRYDGYREWHGDIHHATPLATASGVGIAGRDLTIHCLASAQQAWPVENPRQTPAWRYSRRYGPMPPCFSRATAAILNGRQCLLIGGTASVVGEDSRHAHDIERQLEETFANLTSLIRAAAGCMREPDAAVLDRVVDLRIYMVRPEDGPMIRSAVETRCQRARDVELTAARLCRPELLVEIEGVAEI